MDTKKFLEICARGKTGPSVEKDDWDLDYIIDGVRDLVDEYDFSWDKKVIIPNDEKLLDDMFEAAKKLIVDLGIYNMSAKRIIHFEREEIEEGRKNMKTELVMGEGKDAVTLKARKIEDELLPVVWAGNP